jgi:hypothetical protein
VVCSLSNCKLKNYAYFSSEGRPTYKYIFTIESGQTGKVAWYVFKTSYRTCFEKRRATTAEALRWPALVRAFTHAPHRRRLPPDGQALSNPCYRKKSAGKAPGIPWPLRPRPRLRVSLGWSLQGSWFVAVGAGRPVSLRRPYMNTPVSASPLMAYKYPVRSAPGASK